MQKQTAHQEFQTRDLQIAAALSAAGQALIRLDWQDGRAYFIFRNQSRCEGLVQAYWSGDLKAAAKDYFNSMRELKDRLFQTERDRKDRA
jgi:hypothetical protein